MKWYAILAACILPVMMQAAPSKPVKFEIGETDFLLDGKPLLIKCGEMHFARIPREYWQHRLRLARAMGLNTVCAYLFWNYHEPTPGKFNWSGMADAAEFCRLAQQEGLWVILRPGPYSCAEWDFGGFPWWLLKNPDIKLRTQDPQYLAACRNYLRQVGRQLAPLQATRGGPILMVQVENEYGSYGHDKEYIGILRDYLKEAGFDVPLFTCDGPVQLKADVRPDIFSVVNFGGDPAGGFKALRAIRPTGPLMCGEYYPGWFDSWGTGHHFGSTQKIVNDLSYMMDHNGSFSIYMVHGGTTFGFWAGANSPPYRPQTTSYDYDAPISEAGWDTAKFHALRALFSKHLAAGETLPDVPGRNPVIAIPPVELTDVAPVFANLPASVRSERPKHMELYDQPHGCILYRTKLPAGPAGELKFTQLHDFGLVFLDGQRVATVDRRQNQSAARLPARERDSVLDVFVEAMGRVNYGGHLHDRKGITQKVDWVAGGKTTELTGWEVFNLPLEERELAGLKFTKGATTTPAFHRAQFTLREVGDTFLDLSTWGKGVVWVNGHNLGRYWRIGPTQTMYLPGPWLKKGSNEIIVLELTGAESPVVSGLKEPKLNEVRAEGRAGHRKPGQALRLAGVTPLHAGSFAQGPDWQTVKFAAATGRYFCFESLNSHANDPFASCAELNLLDAAGKELPREGWKIVYCDSEEVGGEDGGADNIMDLQFTTIWHTEWENKKPGHPHQIVIDLGGDQTVTGIRYLPRPNQASGSNPGRIKDYRLYLSAQPLPGL